MKNQNKYLKYILLEFQSAKKCFLLYVLNEFNKFNLKQEIFKFKLKKSLSKKEKLFYEFLNYFNNYDSNQNLRRCFLINKENLKVSYSSLYFNCNLLIYQFLWNAFNELNSRYLSHQVLYWSKVNTSFSYLYSLLSENWLDLSYWNISKYENQLLNSIEWIYFFEKLLNEFKDNKEFKKEFRYFIYFIYLAQEYYLNEKSKITNYKLEWKIKKELQNIKFKRKQFEINNNFFKDEILICKIIFENKIENLYKNLF